MKSISYYLPTYIILFGHPNERDRGLSRSYLTRTANRQPVRIPGPLFTHTRFDSVSSRMSKISKSSYKRYSQIRNRKNLTVQFDMSFRQMFAIGRLIEQLAYSRLLDSIPCRTERQRYRRGHLNAIHKSETE